MPDDVLSGIDDFIVLKTIVYWTIAAILMITTKGRLGYHLDKSSLKT